MVNNNTNQKTKCLIYNIDGKIVMTYQLHPQSHNVINTSQLKPGVYIIKLISNTFEKTEKLIIAE